MTWPRVAGLIDVHHHGLPDAYLHALEVNGISAPVPGATFPRWSPEMSFEVMESAGISTALLSITTPGLGMVTGSIAAKLARTVNEYFADLLRDSPQRLGAFALIPVDDIDAALSEVGYALDVLHLDGIGLFSSMHGRYLGDPGLDPLMAELASRKAPTFVHPSLPSDGRPLFGVPGSVLEFPLETSRALTNLLFSGTLDRHPDLTLIISHAGGAIPFLARRLALAPQIDPDLETRPPKDLISSLRRLHYDVAMSASTEQLSCLHQLVGTTGILFGSDYPFMPRSHALENARGLREFSDRVPGLESATRQNALKLFPRFTATER